MDWKKVYQNLITYGLILLVALAVGAAPVLAEDMTPHTVIITVIDTDGAPRTVPELGCAWSGSPVGGAGNYGSSALCSNCSTATCVFTGTMQDAEGGYAVFGLSDDWNVPTRAPWTGLVGQEKPGPDWQVYVLWWTNAASSGNDWAGTHYITYTLEIPPTPTPTPTNTPTPTPTPTNTPTPTPTPTPYPTAAPYAGAGAREALLAVPAGRPPLLNRSVYTNDAESIVMAGVLPAPLPAVPRRVTFPAISLPLVDYSGYPAIIVGKDSALSQVNARMVDARQTLSAQYTTARAAVTTLRSTTTAMRDFVGSPATSVSAQAGTRALTVNQMATEMAQATTFSLSYLRAVSALGPLGLDIVFVFVGLAWIAFMNFLEWLITAFVWLWKRLLQLLGALLNFIRLVMEVIRTLRALIPFI